VRLPRAVLDVTPDRIGTHTTIMTLDPKAVGVVQTLAYLGPKDSCIVPQ
jgi:hypothetical protein